MSAGAPQSSGLLDNETVDARIERLHQQLRQLISDHDQPRLVQERIESALLRRNLKYDEYQHAESKHSALVLYAQQIPQLIANCRAEIEAAQLDKASQSIAPKVNKFLELAAQLGIDSPEKFQEYLAKCAAVAEVM